MKLFYPLLIAIAACTGAQAQTQPAPTSHPKSQLEFGVGTSLNGTGDYACLKTHLGYNTLINRHLSAGTRIAMISGTKVKYFGPDASVPVSYHAVNLENEVYFAPFGNDGRVVVALGGGAFVGYGQQYNFEYAQYARNANNQMEFTYKPKQTNGLQVGYIASLNTDFWLDARQNWQVGFKLAIQNDNRATVLPGGQLKVSHRL
ncbi:hypothetical protein [Hymenobacter sp. DG25B]|uniref:hypothetical protein n=1 Tax=Hymenobacter sp. DG25B TaxID=1385664 RepID=UPI0012DFEE35|nr:hypothetical protein [Hymenobacter sp. DG25B]